MSIERPNRLDDFVEVNDLSGEKGAAETPLSPSQESIVLSKAASEMWAAEAKVEKLQAKLEHALSAEKSARARYRAILNATRTAKGLESV